MKGKPTAVDLALALMILLVDGCALTTTGGYRMTKDGEISTGVLAMTVKACPTSKGMLEQEAVYVEALRGAARYRLIGDHLEIEDASGATTLVFSQK